LFLLLPPALPLSLLSSTSADGVVDEHGQSPFASNEKMSIANGFSHNQKLAKDNPYAQRGSGLNNNQNHIFDNLRGYPPRDPYMFEVQRARQMRGNQ